MFNIIYKKISSSRLIKLTSLVLSSFLLCTPIYAGSTCNLSGDAPPDCAGHQFTGSEWTFKNDSSISSIPITSIKDQSQPGALLVKGLSDCQPFSDTCTVHVYANKNKTSGTALIKIGDLNPFKVSYSNLNSNIGFSWSTPTKSAVTPGQTLTATLKPSGRKLLAVKALPVNGQLEQVSSDQGSGGGQCQQKGNITSNCDFTFQVKKVSELKAGKQAQLGLHAENIDELTTKPVDIAAFDASLSGDKLGVGKTIKLTVTNKGSVPLTKLNINASNGIKIVSDQSNCKKKLANGGLSATSQCHYTLASSGKANSSKQSVELSSSQTGQNKSYKNIKIMGFESKLSSHTLGLDQTDQLTIKNMGSVPLTKLTLTTSSGLKVVSKNSNCDQKTAKGGLSPGSECHYTVTGASQITSAKQTIEVSSSQTGQDEQYKGIKIIGFKSTLSQDELKRKQTTKLTVANKGSVKITNLSLTTSNGLYVIADQSNCDQKTSGEGLSLNAQCYFTIGVSRQLSSAKQTLHLKSSQTGQDKQYAITLNLNKLKASHTLVSQPDSKQHNYIIIRNATPASIKNLPPISFSLNKAGQQTLGDGVTLDDQTEQASAGSQPNPTCSGVNYTLKPGQQCSVSINVDNDAYGTVFMNATGNFISQSIDIPINVVPSSIKISGPTTYLLSSAKQTPFFMGAPIGSNNYVSSNKVVSIANQGPFDLQNIQYAGAEAKRMKKPCSSIKAGKQCKFQFNNPADNKEWVIGFWHVKYANINRSLQTLWLVNWNSSLTKNPKRDIAFYMIRGVGKIPGVTQHPWVHYTPALSSIELINATYWHGATTQTKLGFTNSQINKNNLSFSRDNCPSKLSFEKQCSKKLDVSVPKDMILGLSNITQIQNSKANYPDTVQLGNFRSLVVGGDFLSANDANTTLIARYGPVAGMSGLHWVGLGALSSGGSVNALLMGQNLYAGGQFSQIDRNQINNIAFYNGAEWSALGKGVTSKDGSATVNALASIDKNKKPSQIIVGGQFDKAGTQDASNFAIWNVSKQKWQVPDSGPQGGSVNALLTGPNNHIWVGGSFTQAGGQSNVTGLTAYNNGSWSHSANNLQVVKGHKQLSVDTLAYLPNEGGQGSILAGGDFKVCQNNECSYGLAVYDLKQNNGWKPFHPKASKAPQLNRMTSGIKTVIRYQNETDNSDRQVLVGGDFMLNGKEVHYASFHLSSYSWNPSFSLPDGPVEAQILNKKHLFIGGQFSSLDEENISDLAKSKIDQSGSLWQALTSDSHQQVAGSGDVIKGGSIKAMTIMDNIKTVKPKWYSADVKRNGASKLREQRNTQ